MTSNSIFLLDDPAAIRALHIERAVLDSQDRARHILDHPAAQPNRHYTIARLLAFETDLSATVCRDILSRLK